MQDGRLAVTFGLAETLRPGETIIGMPMERADGRREVRMNALSVIELAIILLMTLVSK